MEAPSCRFCYEQQEATNPLCTPCACRGSLAHIHIQCLLKWRAITQNPDFVRACELCKQQFAFPLRWQINTITVPKLWILFSNGPLIIGIAYYAHFCAMLVNPTGPLNVYFWYVCCVIAVIYAGLYAYVIWPIHEKWQYVTYWWRSDIVYENYSPRQVVLYTAFSWICVPLCYYPMGAFFLFMLPQLYGIHTVIIERMNTDAEIYPIAI
jgi:hypothetical protein